MQKENKVGRLDFLDILRGIGAVAVLLQHVMELSSPSFSSFTSNYFQFGSFGVILFFLCSGFIIPVSIEKQKSLKTFWRRRFFRLYPLYFFSLIVAVVLVLAGFQSEKLDVISVKNVLLNMTMLQKFLRAPLIIELYWTLNLEFVFYIVMSILLLVGLNKKSTLLAILALLGANFVGIFTNQGFGLAFYFATLFVGTVFYRWYHNETSLKVALTILFLTMTTIFIITYKNLYGKDDIASLGTRSFVPMLSAWLLAYIVFWAAMLVKSRRFPVVLTFLGKISYSLYLMQAVVGMIFSRFVSQFAAGELIVLKIVCSLALASLTYYLIEKPFISIGRGRKKVLVTSIMEGNSHG